MSKTINQRINVSLEDDFVVFLIGIRINHLWKSQNWIPAALAMPTMINELSYILESGFLGYQLIGAFPPVIVQYWKSLEQYEAYTKNRDESHYPVLNDFIQKMRKNSDVAVWHETYKVKDGKFESIFNNISAYGHGKVSKLVPASTFKENAGLRFALNY